MAFIHRFTCVVAAVIATSSQAQQVTVPSGLDVTLYDVILEPGTSLARFRFLVPAIGGDAGVRFGEVLSDIQYLCDDIVLPSLAVNGWLGEEVIISLSAEETSFGVVNSEVVQYFQPFSIQAGACLWEDF